MTKTFNFAMASFAIGALSLFAFAADNNNVSSKGVARVTKEVHHELVTLPYYGVFDNLAYSVAPDLTVTLQGQVTQPVLKSNAESAVKGIEGVPRVINEIEVLPLSPSDDQLRRALFQAVYRTNGLDRYGFQAIPSIHIIVKNGHATLEGVVATEADKNMAGIKANGVPGVFSVTNDLQVEKKS